MTVTTLTLAAFLEARLAEDEESAPFVFAEQFTPARVLAEVAAKRAIIEWDADQGVQYAPLLHLAAVYADHPDYDESWRP